MARRESATRSRWRTERGRLATAATAPHGLHPLSRLWPSNSLPARRAHSNAPAAPADCQCYPGRTSAARTALPRRHSSAAPAWPPPAMPPPAAASSRRRQLPPALQRQLSAAQAPPRPRVSPPRVPPPSASPWPLPPPGGRARTEELHDHVHVSVCLCVWTLEAVASFLAHIRSRFFSRSDPFMPAPWYHCGTSVRRRVTVAALPCDSRCAQRDRRELPSRPM